MRTILGIVLGVLLAVGGAYLYDSTAPRTVAAGEPPRERTIVNWDVASHEWQAIKARAEKNWDRLSSK